jgi:hypothetical protein
MISDFLLFITNQQFQEKQQSSSVQHFRGTHNILGQRDRGLIRTWKSGRFLRSTTVMLWSRESDLGRICGINCLRLAMPRSVEHVTNSPGQGRSPLTYTNCEVCISLEKQSLFTVWVSILDLTNSTPPASQILDAKTHKKILLYRHFGSIGHWTLPVETQCTNFCS